MKESWQKLADRFAALQARERALVAVALIGGILLVGYRFVIEPAWLRGQVAERAMQEQRALIGALQAQQAILASPEADPERRGAEELKRLKAELGVLAERLIRLEASLVPPQRMAQLLEDMIGRRAGLRLLSLKTLPVAPFVEKKASVAEKAPESAGSEAGEAGVGAGLFKHGVEIRVEGSYPDLAAYLERLEQARQKMLWSSVAVVSSADKPGRLVLTLTVYTLSLDRTWLII